MAEKPDPKQPKAPEIEVQATPEFNQIANAIDALGNSAESVGNNVTDLVRHVNDEKTADGVRMKKALDIADVRFADKEAKLTEINEAIAIISDPANAKVDEVTALLQTLPSPKVAEALEVIKDDAHFDEIKTLLSAPTPDVATAMQKLPALRNLNDLENQAKRLREQIDQLEHGGGTPTPNNSLDTLDYSAISKNSAEENIPHTNQHRRALDLRRERVRERLRQLRTDLSAVEAKKVQLEEARYRIEHLGDKDAAEIEKRLSEIQKETDARVAQSKPNLYRNWEKRFGKYGVDPRMVAGTAIGAASIMAPSASLVWAVLRGISATGGGMIAGDAAGQRRIEQDQLNQVIAVSRQLVEQRHAAAAANLPAGTPPPPQPTPEQLNQEAQRILELTDPAEVGHLVREYLEHGTQPPSIKARAQRLVEVSAKLGYIASVKGLQIDAAMAESDADHVRDRRNTLGGRISQFLAGENQQGRSGGRARLNRILTGLGVAAASTAVLSTGGIVGVLGAAAINIAYNAAQKAGRKETAFGASAVVKGIGLGILEYAKAHTDEFDEIADIYDQEKIDTYKKQAEGQRRRWAFGTGAAFGAVAATMGYYRIHGINNDQEHIPPPPESTNHMPVIHPPAAEAATIHGAGGGTPDPVPAAVTRAGEDAGMVPNTPTGAGVLDQHGANNSSGVIPDAVHGTGPKADIPTGPAAPASPELQEKGVTLHIEDLSKEGKILHSEIAQDGHSASYNLAKEVIKGHIEQAQQHAPGVTQADGAAELYKHPFNENDPVVKDAIHNLEEKWKQEGLFTKDGALNRTYLDEKHIDLTKDMTGGIDSQHDAKEALTLAEKHVPQGPTIPQNVHEADKAFDVAPNQTHPGLRLEDLDTAHATAAPDLGNMSLHADSMLGRADTGFGLSLDHADGAAQAATGTAETGLGLGTMGAESVGGSGVEMPPADLHENTKLMASAALTGAGMMGAVLEKKTESKADTEAARKALAALEEQEAAGKAVNVLDKATKTQVNDALITLLGMAEKDARNMDEIDRMETLKNAILNPPSGLAYFISDEKNLLERTGLDKVLSHGKTLNQNEDYKTALVNRIDAILSTVPENERDNKQPQLLSADKAA